jgi:hypothetical protein
MKGSKLVGLIVIAAVLAALAWFTAGRSRQRAAPSQVGKRVLPDLAVNDIERLTVTAPGATAAVARAASGWVVPAKFNYPANFEKISGALRALADLKVGQVMHLTPAQKAELNLVAPDSAGAAATNGGAGTRVLLAGAAHKPIAAFVLGKNHLRQPPSEAMGSWGGYPDGRYLALPDGAAYLVTETLDEFAAADTAWLDMGFISVNTPDLQRLRISVTNRSAYTLARPTPTSELQPDGLATNETVESSRLSQLTGALGFLRFEDIADPQLAPAQSGLDQPSAIVAETQDGHCYTLKIGRQAPATDRYYAMVAVAFQPPAETNLLADAAAGAAGAATNAAERAAKAEEIRKKAEAATTLNAKLSRWIYLLSASTVESLTPERAHLLKHAEEPKEEKPDAAAEPPEEAETPSPAGP